MSINKWDKRFLDLALFISGWSKDPSTRCGAVITRGNRIISLGFNGFPSGVHDDGRLEDRETKYKMVLHAEDNALLFAKQDLTGCTIYTQPFPPCSRCAGKIIQSGITKVIAPTESPELWNRWRDDLTLASDMFREAGVTLIKV
jgi:dCMP deaminase